MSTRALPASPDELPPFAFTGRKLGAALLVYVLCVIGVITLEPFVFHVPAHVTVMLWDDYAWLDPFANVVLFLPLGFLYALTRSATDRTTPAVRRRTLRAATLLGFLASSSIELTQVFEPARYPSPTDVATNTLGAALGAWLFFRASTRFRADSPLVGKLALELPLMGLVYLVVPLCSLAAVTVGGGPALGAHLPLPRGVGLVALALFGGTLLGHVQRRHFGPGGILTPRQIALAAAGWFVVGALPALATAPLVFVTGAAAAALAAWRHGSTRDRGTPLNRRFEVAALLRAVPWLAAYLALVPLTAPAGAASTNSRVGLLRAVESLAGFTVLGYVLAEAWGRLELRYRFTAWRVALVALIVADAVAVLGGAAVPRLAALPAIAAHVLAAAYGGWIYHLQRAHVRALVAARSAARGTVVAPPTPTTATRLTA